MIVYLYFFSECSFLDARDFPTWLEMLDEEFHLYMPISQNVRYDMLDQEQTREAAEMCWFDEGIDTIRKRVAQINTGLHWAEEPRSRTTHVLTNVRLDRIEEADGAVVAVDVSSAFFVYRNRGEIETDHLVGRRRDRLLRQGETWKIARREVHLSQSVLLAKNLTTFF